MPPTSTSAAQSAYLSLRESEQWVRDNRPQNTGDAYRTYADQFEAYAFHHGQVSVPAVPNTVANFLRHLYEDNGLAAQTICRVARSAVGDLHRFRDESPHTHDLVKATCKVIAVKAKKSVRRTPIRTPVLKLLVATFDVFDLQELMGETMLVFSFKGFLRSAECTGLGKDDVWLETITIQGVPQLVLFLFIEKSKVDQTRIGHTVVLGQDRACPWKCPVRHFRALSKKRCPKAEAFFYDEATSSRFPPKRVNMVLKEACARAGIDAKLYTSHGLRAGGATESAANGVRTRQIMRHGNWKSSAVYIYIHDDVEQQLKVSLAF